MCFFANEDQTERGEQLGMVHYRADSKDTTELVGIILLSLVGVPVFCASTISCYAHKHRKLRKKLRRMRFVQLREEIESRLVREMGLDPSDDDAAA